MKQSNQFIRTAEREGWTVSLTRNGHLKFTMPGARTVYASGSTGDKRRSWQNTRRDMRRAMKERR